MSKPAIPAAITRGLTVALLTAAVFSYLSGVTSAGGVGQIPPRQDDPWGSRAVQASFEVFP